MKPSAYRQLAKILVGALEVGVAVLAPLSVRADEGGVSMWLPGLYGSLAAVPQAQPGWSSVTTYYHTSVSAGGDISRAREVTIGNVPINVSATANANLKATADLGLLVLNYAFATPLFGGQASASLMSVYGRQSTSLAGTLSGTATLPGGATVPFSRSDSISDSVSGFGDLYPQFTVRWNAGVHNYMAYLTGSIPVGAYEPARLSNMGIGHGTIDFGGGYTYFDPQTGHEFSGVLGFTENFKNPYTQYQNGVDLHFDWGASQFLTKQWQVGLVGYLYDQLSCDSGSGDRVGCSNLALSASGRRSGTSFPSTKSGKDT